MAKILKIPASDKDTFIVVGDHPGVSTNTVQEEDIIEFEALGICPDMTCTVVNGIKVCACREITP